MATAWFQEIVGLLRAGKIENEPESRRLPSVEEEWYFTIYGEDGTIPLGANVTANSVQDVGGNAK